MRTHPVFYTTLLNAFMAGVNFALGVSIPRWESLLFFLICGVVTVMGIYSLKEER